MINIGQQNNISQTGKVARLLCFVMSFIMWVNLSFGEQKITIADWHVSPHKEQLYDSSSNMPRTIIGTAEYTKRQHCNYF